MIMVNEEGTIKDQDQVQDQSKRLLTRVAVFWDIENCQPPAAVSGTAVVQDLRHSLLEFGSIRQIRAYADLNLLKASMRLELQRSGIQLLDVPSAKKDAADKMMLTDMMMFALDNPPPQRIILISGDQDFAYTLARLRNIGYEIVLVIPPVGAHPTLRAQADFIINWQDLFQLKKELTDGTYLEALIEVLKEFQEREELSPAFAVVGKRLNQRYPAWRNHTGQQKLINYIESARKQGLVEITGTPPKLHVSLVEEKLKEPKRIAKEDRFAPLLKILNNAHNQGNEEVEFAAIGMELRIQDPDWQETLGVRRLKDYMLEAKEAGYVEIRSVGLQHYAKIPKTKN